MVFKTIETLANNNQSFRSGLYNWLVKMHHAKSDNKYWKRAWRRVILKQVTKPVSTILHGYKAQVNCGFMYPLVARMHKQLNNPLVQLAYQVYQQKGHPITLVDVGAAVGDTVFLLQSNIPGAFKKILCVDGDPEFFSFLESNMQQFAEVECVNALLSDGVHQENTLVRTHAGTASAQGSDKTMSVSLDELVKAKGIQTIDVLKIDTDGFDGKVLSGASEILQKQKPAVIFEWHPILLHQTNNDLYKSFSVLESYGYTNFVFYTKYGNFSHFMFSIHFKELEQLANVCLRDKFTNDWHYDVIALHGSSIDMLELAECSYARKKPSAY